MSIRALSRRLLVWLYLATSLVGLVAAPTHANAYAVVGSVAVVTGLSAFLYWVVTERTLGADRLVTVAITSAALPTALAAIFTVLGGAGIAIGLLLLALAAMATLDPMKAHLMAPPGAGDPAPATRAPAEEAPKDAALSTMSSWALLTRWRACGSGLDAVQLRADILDELERRDPVAVNRWIREGDGARPAGYRGHDTSNARGRGLPRQQADGDD